MLAYKLGKKLLYTLILSVMAITILSGGAMAADVKELIPIGRTAGIKMLCEGVLVVKLTEVQSTDGTTTSPAKVAGINVGDSIISIDGKEIATNEDLQKAVMESQGVEIDVVYKTNGNVNQVKILPIADKDGNYKIGIWVRDSMAGIGTITFVDPATGKFGSLGHGICDIDTGLIMPFSKGSIMQASVVDVKKGEVGVPGELNGEFNLNNDLGRMYSNKNTGVYGDMFDDLYYKDKTPISVADTSEIKTGKATILSNVDGDTVEEYEIEILKKFPENDELNRCMMIRITDSRLIEKTGGIVQGMSGSPILQNGKIIGAVTHVLVNDPQRGYGIYIDKMIQDCFDFN